MFIPSIIPALLADQIRQVVNLFKHKNAVNKDHALSFTETEWKSLGFTMFPSLSEISKYPFIQTSGDRYWLDEVKLKEYNDREELAVKRMLRMFFYAFIGLLIFVAMMITANVIFPN